MANTVIFPPPPLFFRVRRKQLFVKRGLISRDCRTHIIFYSLPHCEKHILRPTTADVFDKALNIFLKNNIKFFSPSYQQNETVGMNLNPIQLIAHIKSRCAIRE